MTVEDIKNILENEPLIKELIIKGKTPWQYNKNQSIFKEINNKYNMHIKTFMEFLYLLKNKNNLENLHIFCETCGNKNKFCRTNIGYNKFCSISCGSRNIKTIKKSKHTRLIKYGDENYNNVEKIVETSRNNIDEFGRNSYNRMVMHNKKSKERNHGDPNYNNSQKANYTKSINIDEEGLNSFQRISKKTRMKKKEKYNDEYYCNPIKIVHTRMNNIDENGKNSYERAVIKGIKTALTNIDENGLNAYQRGVLKSKQRMFILRGVEHYTQLPEYKNKFKNKDYVQAIIRKRYDTMKKNKSFNRRSKAEIRCFNLLKTKFSDAEHSYFDKKRYPFNCDMYVPSLDLFIECHFGEFHYKEPFDLNNTEHLKRLQKLKLNEQRKLMENKKHTRYSSMIKCWTILDPKKLNILKNNNLNYKIFYTEKEFNEWFNKL